MKIVNLGILAHVDAGKTTVTEGLLVHSGAKKRMGRVDDGTTTTDSLSLERRRGMTIRAATVSFSWRDTKINLIDTPGHMDFIAEVERSLAVLDGVILVISGREGVQPQTRVIFEKLRAMHIPAILFINKIDRVGVSLDGVYADIRRNLTGRVVPMQCARDTGTRDARVLPLADTEGPLFDAVVESDDALLERYLNGERISPETIRRALWEGTRTGALYPAYLGAALHDVGIAPLLDAVADCFAWEAGDAPGPLCAYIYKVEWDEYDHKRAYLRVFSGALRIRSQVSHAGAEEKVYVRGLMTLGDGGFGPAGTVTAGDIGVLLDAPNVRCGDFLGEAMALPVGSPPAQPLLTVGITPDATAGRPALLNALTRMTEEDPILRLSIHPETEEISLRLYGMLQLEIIQAMLLERFGVRASFSPLRTLYKEQPREAVGAQIRIGTPGNQHQAGIAFTVVPTPPGSGVSYETRVSYGDLERSFQNAVGEGAMAGLAQGLGNEIVDARVIFTDMDYSSVTSTPADYRRLAPLVVRMALEEAELRRLEPWLRFFLTAPHEHQRKVLTAINRVRAVLAAVEHGETEVRIRGEAPLDTTKEFAAELLSMTQGRGLFEASFLEYREVREDRTGDAASI